MGARKEDGHRRRISRGRHCPTCGATRACWRKDPERSPEDIGKYGGEALVPADQVDSYSPKDVFRCPRCGFVGVVYAHPEDTDGYVDWDDWECTPSYCPKCGNPLGF